MSKPNLDRARTTSISSLRWLAAEPNQKTARSEPLQSTFGSETADAEGHHVIVAATATFAHDAHHCSPR